MNGSELNVQTWGLSQSRETRQETLSSIFEEWDSPGNQFRVPIGGYLYNEGSYRSLPPCILHEEL